MDDFRAYLDLLRELSGSLDRLTGLAKEKTAAVRKDDLMGLDAALKQEQAMSLALRGLEQKRLTLLKGLGLENTPLTELPANCPAELRNETKKAVETLRRSYEVYRTAADVARDTLECNLHELEKLVEQMGGRQTGGAGYAAPSAEPPKKMKTDFRA